MNARMADLLPVDTNGQILLWEYETEDLEYYHPNRIPYKIIWTYFGRWVKSPKNWRYHGNSPNVHRIAMIEPYKDENDVTKEAISYSRHANRLIIWYVLLLDIPNNTDHFFTNTKKFAMVPSDVESDIEDVREYNTRGNSRSRGQPKG